MLHITTDNEGAILSFTTGSIVWISEDGDHLEIQMPAIILFKKKAAVISPYKTRHIKVDKRKKKKCPQK
jgi:hypothetical protein